MSTYPEHDHYPTPTPTLRLLTALHEMDDDTEADAPPETVVARAVAIPLDRRGRAGE